jgi:glycosyltransferase involved in cell wall biosynthesis
MDLAVVHPFLYTRGGAERVVLEIARHFEAKIFCSRFVPEGTFPEFRELDVEVLKTRASMAVPSFLPLRVRDAVEAGLKFYNRRLGDFDVINAHGTPSEWIRHKNSPVVWYCHTPNREASDLYEWRMGGRMLHEKAFYWSMLQPYRLIAASIMPKIEFVFANSANVQGRLRRYLNRESEVLNPCVNAGEFKQGEYEKYFFYPSRITPEKRFEYAIIAFKEFKKTHADWKLVIAGALFKERREHVAYYQKIKKMLASDGEIQLDIPREKLVNLYSNCNSVLYTPINEDFGIVPLEAMASHKPCIAVNEGGPREVILDKTTGYLINSEEEMTKKMNTLASDTSLAKKMGNAGRKHVEKNYSWKHFFEVFERACRKVAKTNEG